MHSTKASEEVMQAAHDPYHGITLPEPPAGYRLAKWGEKWTTEDAVWRDANKWVSWPYGSKLVKWHMDDTGYCIFAIPLEQPLVSEEFRKAAEIEANTPINSPVPSPLKSWQFREVPWVQPSPKTLADVPENVDAVTHDDEGGWHVVYRVAGRSYCAGSSTYFSEAKNAKFIRYLDPPPQTPMSLDDVPDGRVVDDHGRKYWTDGRTWWRVTEEGCVFKNVTPPERFTVTNYIAEFRGPA